jgi:hypothetical protein
MISIHVKLGHAAARLAGQEFHFTPLLVRISAIVTGHFG